MIRIPLSQPNLQPVQYSISYRDAWIFCYIRRLNFHQYQILRKQYLYNLFYILIVCRGSVDIKSIVVSNCCGRKEKSLGSLVMGTLSFFKRFRGNCFGIIKRRRMVNDDSRYVTRRVLIPYLLTFHIH